MLKLAAGPSVNLASRLSNVVVSSAFRYILWMRFFTQGAAQWLALLFPKDLARRSEEIPSSGRGISV